MIGNSKGKIKFNDPNLKGEIKKLNLKYFPLEAGY